MKPTRYILSTILLLFVLSGGFVFAELEPLPQGPQSPEDVLQIIVIISNWVFAIFLAISVIFLVWGAFEFVTGEGNPERVSSAKKRLLYAIIGISIALLANGVDDVLRSIIT